jgi:hypothetical protein
MINFRRSSIIAICDPVVEKNSITDNRMSDIGYGF